MISLIERKAQIIEYLREIGKSTQYQLERQLRWDTNSSRKALEELYMDSIITRGKIIDGVPRKAIYYWLVATNVVIERSNGIAINISIPEKGGTDKVERPEVLAETLADNTNICEDQHER